MSAQEAAAKQASIESTAPPLSFSRTVKLLKRYLPILLPNWPELVLLIVILPLAGAVITVVPALCHRMIIDVAFPRHSVVLLAIFGGTAVSMIVLERFLLVMVRNATNAHLRKRVIEVLGRRFYRNMLDLNMRYHQTTPVGEKIFRSDTDILDTAELLGSAFPMTALYLCQFLVTIVAVCLIDWRPIAIAVACSPVFLFIAQQFFNYYRKIDLRQRIQGQKLTSFIEQSLSNISVVYSHGARKKTMLQYFRALVGYSTANMIYFFLHQVSIVIVWPSSMPAAVATYIIGLCAFWVISGSITLGQWQALSLLIIQAIVPLGILLNYYQMIRLRMIPAERILHLLDLDDRVQDAPDAVALTEPLRGDIEFENVWFSYSPGKTVLKGVSFKITAGSRVAFVGPSGIGKSTILNLILRFYEPDSGRILVDGRDIRTYRLAEYRRQFGIVLQSPVIFERTLRENILYGVRDNDMLNLDEVLRSTNLEEAVHSLPNGLDTLLEGSGSLSLGQRQCVAVARCMAGAPNVALLDEPTALADPEAKHAIVEGIDAAAAGKTALFISHDLLTLHSLDRIIVLNQGIVWEEGSHEELLDKQGLYCTLWSMQTELGESGHSQAGEVET